MQIYPQKPLTTIRFDVPLLLRPYSFQEPDKIAVVDTEQCLSPWQ
jgi:hypothetical protein